MEDREDKRLMKVKAGHIGGIISGISRRKEAKRSVALSNEAKERKGKEIKGNKRKGKIPPKFSDSDFIETLKTNPAYKDINIDNELGKMDAYLMTKPGRQKTRRFIVAWLNRIELPVTVFRKAKDDKPPEPINPVERAKVAALIHATAEKMKGNKKHADKTRAQPDQAQGKA